MKMWKGTATGADGRSVDVQVSNQRTLLKFADGSFAVKDSCYRVGACPYLVFGTAVRMTVAVSNLSAVDSVDSVTADYVPFRKGTQSLPNTCIESAEHVLKGLHVNAHSTACITNGTGARVSMSIGTRTADIDEEDMIDTAFGAFPDSLENVVDASREGFEPGDGMALVYSRKPSGRGKNWTVHAVAVLLKSTSVWDPFIVVSEVFAPDDGSTVQMTTDWDLACFLGAQDFKDSYFSCMPTSKYTLWKLSAATR